MKISPARISAFEILLRIEKDRAYSSVLLPAYEAKLSDADRGLCHEIVLGALRRQMLLDRYIDTLSKGKRLDREIRVILRLSLYQMMFLERVPSHAIVNDAVNLALKAKKTSAKSFVNALLRAFERERPELEYTDEWERISIETSHPIWILKKWENAFGRETAIAIARTDNEAPEDFFRATAKSSVENLGDLSKEELRSLAESGEVYFQDKGSQMIADAVALRPGEKFLDVCSAPGSKITLIASKEELGTNLLVGGDIHLKRVQFLRDNAARQGAANVRVVQYDASDSLPFSEGAFDAVLVDAPCTGTGTIRHNPEIRYFLEESSAGELAEKQLNILSEASKVIGKGGRLIYSTCSLEREENEGVCERFLAEHPEISRTDPAVPGKVLTAGGFGRTFPNRDEMDGFFVASFEKK